MSAKEKKNTKKTRKEEAVAQTVEEKAQDIKAPEAESKTGKEDRDQDELLNKLREENALLNDKFLRLYSDFENFRKRTSRERLDLLKSASEDIITALLPVLDDFDRALKTIETHADDDPIAEGIRLIHSKMLNTLTQKGLEPADAMGKEFDTDFHEAITNIPAPTEDQKGKVIDVTERGYLLNGKVIRYAKVVVGV